MQKGQLRPRNMSVPGNGGVPFGFLLINTHHKGGPSKIDTRDGPLLLPHHLPKAEAPSSRKERFQDVCFGAPRLAPDKSDKGMAREFYAEMQQLLAICSPANGLTFSGSMEYPLVGKRVKSEPSKMHQDIYNSKPSCGHPVAQVRILPCNSPTRDASKCGYPHQFYVDVKADGAKLNSLFAG